MPASAAPGGRPLAVCLHYLGGSARSWDALAASLPGLAWLALDLPGFGDAAGQPGASVAGMADAVAAALRGRPSSPWMLVGHSMGAKVACALARRAEDGAPGLEGLAGLVLLAGSPPGPEPMDEARRHRMLGWFAGSAAESRAQAEAYVDANVAARLDQEARALAVQDVLRASRHAWAAWLERGSREDWAGRVGVLKTPALLVAGDRDADLGPDAQARLMAPHFADATRRTLPDARHLLPQECTRAVARLIAPQAERMGAAA
jgi:pimeloyl-ACP methyl ester carboxylesterase